MKLVAILNGLRAGAIKKRCMNPEFAVHTPRSALVIRWTIGNVSPYGFDALRLSIWGARKVFGNRARYVVCVNSMPVEKARELTGDVPAAVIWRDQSNELPEFMSHYIDRGMGGEAGWKFAPLRIDPNAYELSLDNDCILWSLPAALRGWGDQGSNWCVFAEDVAPCFGKFAHLCGPEPRNSGIRGIAPSFDLEGKLRSILDRERITLISEVDEQGLQAAALARNGFAKIVRTREVSICSPFPPHMPELGRCGAHFVGINRRFLPWSFQGRPAIEFIREHWLKHQPVLQERIFGNR